ncbi:hypothetical protein [Planobispora takensis]|uniref:MBL fold metallo-hydrolase n=1 Tax=Planobispora takensis TaxID=1367882 RepID=A0A8J3T504_9ACTN|nr:hypothetical protein [Planobispora takensis]GII05833.1 hypothetical protein Pta02_78410 [Planobispora takensis]
MHHGDNLDDAGRALPARAPAQRTVLPVHYEGWQHFRENREDIERELAAGPRALRESLRWLTAGDPADVAV